MPAMNHDEHYVMIIEWSDEDHAYLVRLPDWEGRIMNRYVTHGDTYEDAVRRGQEAIEALIEWTLRDGEPLPRPGRAIQVS